MMALPGRVTVETMRLVALLELAEWGARSEADRLLVLEVRGDLQQLGERFAAAQVAQKGNKDATDHSGPNSSAESAESARAGDGDGGGAGAESNRARGGVDGGGE